MKNQDRGIEIDEALMGSIALKLLVRKIAGNGSEFSAFTDIQAVSREIPNIAKKTGFKPEELSAFYRQLMPQVIAVRIGCRAVSLEQ